MPEAISYSVVDGIQTTDRPVQRLSEFVELISALDVGDEQVDASHVDGAYQRVELEVFDADATTERRLQKSSVGVGCGAPTDCIEKGFQRVRVVLPSDGWQACAFDDLCAGLDLPYDLQFLAEAVLVDG